MIPKIIHYCWFGQGKQSKVIRRCMRSWHKHLPGYRFVEWNESNFDVNCNPFVAKAYAAKRYAFVADYARFYALEQLGGIYLDTDQLLLGPLDAFLDCDFFIGFENGEVLGAGIIGSLPGNPFCREVLRRYQAKDAFPAHPAPLTYEITDLFFAHYDTLRRENCRQSAQGVALYSSDYFYPRDYYSQVLTKTEHTVAIHEYMASWMSKSQRRQRGRYAFFHRLWLYPWRLVRRILPSADKR
ncbi:MAG: glycosyl transferase [Oscillospiraceae bacterium]|jgi:mannosyltransferase OCH1-like enzyme|nr:glycosyl transferase [Oscillospiraceae bacterium]